MLCAIYRSTKREQTYIYIENKDDFSRVPKELVNNFGKPAFVMMLALDKRDRLAGADINRVKNALIDDGFYLQIPPLIETLLPRPESVD